MTTRIDTLIIGGGQAGLATSYYLGKLGREHLVLEHAAQAGSAWRNDRWDSFALLTPNWSFQLPGAPYQGAAPEAFMPRDEIVARFEQYTQRFRLPVQYGVRVCSVTPTDGGYTVQSEAEVFQARQVVVATGLYQRPKLPAFASQLSGRVAQVHSGKYRNPSALPDGAVLVVGSGQSGAQIAEELYFSGRKVYLCVSSAGRAPRRYRGKDIYEWLHLSGFLDRTVEKLPSPKARFNANPHLSSRDGGRTLNLHQFARDGVRLLGRLRGGQGERLFFHSDLHENLEKADRFEAELARLVDDYIQRLGLRVPEETLPQLRDGYALAETSELDLRSAGINTIIWAMGYDFDFNLVKLPIFDEFGYPRQRRGVTEYAGLYFVGLPWLHKQKSGLLVGVGEDAQYIAERIAERS